MSDPRWYRSFYWRIALGLFAFLLLMQAAQGALFVWMIDQTAGSMPARSPRRLAVLVASDVGAALTADPNLRLDAYIREQYEHVFRPFAIVMRDGTVVANHEELPDDLRAAVEDEALRTISPPARPGGPRESRPLPPDGPYDISMIFVNREPVGRVVVLGRFPRERMFSEMGPTFVLAATVALVIGMTAVALMVFGPVRRRLGAVQDAAERLGRGEGSARAPERGGDEVAAVAVSFNRMADELERRAQALEAADRARRQLLADVSHELMTPLTAMRGYVETLGMADLTLDAATRQRYLGIIDTETHRLERIVGDLLDLAKLEEGGTALRREPVRVVDLFDRVRERHERECVARRIAWHATVDPAAAVIAGDSDRLEQALQNLVANALRHTPDGGTIALTAAPAEGAVRLTVRDSGPGIPDTHLPLIFDRFYKVDASRKAAGGSGLGLSIVKAIVERHGGTIAARNEGGAVFELLLPHPAPA